LLGCIICDQPRSQDFLFFDYFYFDIYEDEEGQKYQKIIR